ncbi:MAG: aldo/keto reductase [Phycisphaeraceae bacterium]|nr:aldo/keto reductase [Phycisphaeraceae bacterium]
MSDQPDDARITTIQGQPVPSIGLGTWQLRGDSCRESVADALSIGYRHLDTAQMYENEAEVAAGIADAGVDRDEIFLTTKLQLESLAADRVEPATDESLKRLDTDYVDLLLVHWPTDDVEWPATFEAMARVQEAGKARHLGVSNFTPEQVERAADSGITVFCNQVEYHPLLAQPHICRQAQEMDYLLTAYSPVARGKVDGEITLKRIAAAHEKTPAQIALRWLIEQTNVVAIPKAASPEHRRANIDIFDFTLTEDEHEQIHQIDRGQRLVDPDFAPDWQRPANS